MDLQNNAAPIGELQEEGRRARTHGLAAGVILYETLKDHYIGRKRGLQVVKKDFAAIFNGKKNWGPLSVATIENAWRDYQGAAHLWAAHRLCAEDYMDAGLRYAFPCRLDDFTHFLWLAECFRTAGEMCQQRKKGGKLLKPGSSWAAPDGLGIPALEIEWLSAKQISNGI